MPTVADLTMTSDFTFALLDDTWAWRQRITETYNVNSVWHVQVTTSYQLELPSALTADYVDPSATHVRALVPLATKPKAALFGFSVAHGEQFPAHLLLRASTASIQAEYLTRLVLARPEGSEISALLPTTVLEAICLFAPDPYREIDPYLCYSPSLVARYLNQNLSFAVDERWVRRWQAMERESAGILVSALADEQPEGASSSEHPLLALPLIEPPPSCPQDVDEMISNYVDGVAEAQARDQGDFLEVLAEYGRRWEMIVETRLSVAEPTTMVVHETRPWHLQGRWLEQRLSVGDARSAHAEFRVADNTVRIKKFAARDPLGVEVGIPTFEAARATDESLALYTSQPARPYYVDVRLKLRVSGVLMWSAVVLLVVLAATLGEVAAIPGADAGTLGLLTAPSTFGVAVVLVREQSSLATRVFRTWRSALLLGVLFVWMIVCLRLAHMWFSEHQLRTFDDWLRSHAYGG